MINSKFIIFAVSLLVCMSFSSSKKCDLDLYKKKCITQLGEGYTFLKSYSLEKNKSKEFNHSFVFSKNINYMITCANDKNAQVEIKLYNKNKKLLFSNYNKKKNQFYKVNYPCEYTGIHYITFEYHDKPSDCGLGVLAFKRKSRF